MPLDFSNHRNVDFNKHCLAVTGHFILTEKFEMKSVLLDIIRYARTLLIFCYGYFFMLTVI